MIKIHQLLTYMVIASCLAVISYSSNDSVKGLIEMNSSTMRDLDSQTQGSESSLTDSLKQSQPLRSNVPLLSVSDLEEQFLSQSQRQHATNERGPTLQRQSQPQRQ